MRSRFQPVAAGALFAAAAFLLALLSPIRHESSDPRGALLTAQALLEHGTLQLDAWPDAFPAGDRNFSVVRGHRYYVFPPGTSVLAVPLVAAARAMGLDLARPQDDHAVQNAVSALTVAAIAGLLVPDAVLRYDELIGRARHGQRAERDVSRHLAAPAGAWQRIGADG